MRRHGRECALQILYQMDMQSLLDTSDEAGKNKAISDFWASFDKVGADDRRFASRLVDGVIRTLADLDHAIEAVSHRWKMGRMAQVDRNLLRMAAYEIIYCADIPKSATINEAIEVAKRFSGQESFAFINGILDKLEPESTDEDEDTDTDVD